MNKYSTTQTLTRVKVIQQTLTSSSLTHSSMLLTAFFVTLFRDLHQSQALLLPMPHSHFWLLVPLTIQVLLWEPKQSSLKLFTASPEPVSDHSLYHLCSYNTSIPKPTHKPHERLFWYNKSLSNCILTNTTRPYFQITTAPQLTLYSNLNFPSSSQNLSTDSR